MWTSEVWRTWAKYCRWVVLLPRGLPGQTTSNDGHGTQHILPTVTPKKNGNYNPTLFLAYPASYQMSPLRSGSTVQRTEYHGRSEWVALSGLTSFSHQHSEPYPALERERIRKFCHYYRTFAQLAWQMTRFKYGRKKGLLQSHLRKKTLRTGHWGENSNKLTSWCQTQNRNQLETYKHNEVNWVPGKLDRSAEIAVNLREKERTKIVFHLWPKIKNGPFSQF